MSSTRIQVARTLIKQLQSEDRKESKGVPYEPKRSTKGRFQNTDSKRAESLNSPAIAVRLTPTDYEKLLVLVNGNRQKLPEYIRRLILADLDKNLE